MTPLTDEHCEHMIDMLYQIMECLVGTSSPNNRMLTMERFARKVFVHAVSVQHLRYGSNLKLSIYPDGAHLFDIASIAVITRSILETYLKLWDICVDPSDDDDLSTYRHACYELRGFAIREREDIRARITSSPYYDKSEIDEKIQSNDDLREVIKGTNHYKSLDHNRQKQSLEGMIFPKRGKKNSPIQFGIDAGFGSTFMNHYYALQSDYAHGGSLSIAQIHSVVDDVEKLKFINSSRVCVMVVLARLILDYAKMFSPANDTYQRFSEDSRRLINIYSTVSKLLDEI